MKLHVGGFACVLSGKNKKTIAKILEIRGDKIKLEGINIQTHFCKSKENKTLSSIKKIEGSIHISKVKSCEAPEFGEVK